MGAKEPQPARALYGASAYAARRTPSPGRLRASPAAVATHHHLTPTRPSCLGWERPSDGRVRQTRVVSAFSGRFHTSGRARARGVRGPGGRPTPPGAATGGRAPPRDRASRRPPWCISLRAARGPNAGARSRAAGAYMCRPFSPERLVIVPCLIIVAIMLT